MSLEGSGRSASAYSRPLISLVAGKVYHNQSACRVVLRKSRISIGCSDITPEVMRYILAEYDKRFAGEEFVLQP